MFKKYKYCCCCYEKYRHESQFTIEERTEENINLINNYNKKKYRIKLPNIFYFYYLQIKDSLLDIK